MMSSARVAVATVASVLTRLGFVVSARPPLSTVTIGFGFVRRAASRLPAGNTVDIQSAMAGHPARADAKDSEAIPAGH